MYGRQVTKKDLATLVQQMDSNIDFESAVALVDKLLAQHPDGDTQAVRKILEFEMMEALMESEVRDEQGLIVESLVNLMRLDNADPDKILGDFPDEIQQAVRSRMQFEDEFSAEQGCRESGIYPMMVCSTCGYDPHDAVFYQSKQAGIDYPFDEWREELEFYFYDGSHGDNCSNPVPTWKDKSNAEDYAGDYMVQSDVARIMDSAARLTMMTFDLTKLILNGGKANSR